MLEGDQCSSPTTPSAASLQPRTGKGLGCQTQACWTHQVSLRLSPKAPGAGSLELAAWLHASAAAATARLNRKSEDTNGISSAR